MAGKTFVGVNGVSRKPKAIYVGVNGVARKVKAAYVGVNGVARKVWPANLIPDDSYMSLPLVGCNGTDLIEARIETGLAPFPKNRVVLEFMLCTAPNYNSSDSSSPTYISNYSLLGCSSYAIPTGIADTSYICPNDFFIKYNRNTQKITFCARYGVYVTTGNVTTLSSNADEGILVNTKYKVDFMNNNKVYLYCDKGFYSIASNNLLGTFNVNWAHSNGGDNNMRLMFPLRNDYRFYSAKIYNPSGTLIRDYIPGYRISDNKVGLYDLVQKIFYLFNPEITMSTTGLIVE